MPSQAAAFVMSPKIFVTTVTVTVTVTTVIVTVTTTTTLTSIFMIID